MKEIYRFRNTNSLIKTFKELQNQEIYFASPEELNDPMEGYRDVFWKGDSIIWKNFFLNYIKSLEHIFKIYSIIGETKTIGKRDIIESYQLVRNLKPIDTELRNQICQNLFELNFIKKLPDSLSKRSSPVRRSELKTYLQIIHPFVLNEISNVYLKKGLIQYPGLTKELNDFQEMLQKTSDLPKILDEMEKENNAEKLETLLSVFDIYSQTIQLQTRKSFEKSQEFENRLFLVSEFPNSYLDKIIEEIYPPWYSASFLTNFKNSAIWGHYGDNHKGVCLIFKTEEDADGDLILNLETEYGYNSGPVVGMRPHILKKIQYQNKPIEIDFFRSIGRLTKMELNKIWYQDEMKNKSVCSVDLIEDEEAWRNNYWDNFNQSFSIKLKEWEYEKEYRLVVNGDFIDYSDKTSRKLKYDFDSLKGIIFGIRTSTTDKLDIMNIIDEKCNLHNRKDFEYHQAYYSRNSGQIETFKLPN